MRIKSLLIALALGVTALGTAQSAQAALADCDANRVCLWGNTNFVWLIGERAPGGGWVNLVGDRNDQMQSWANRTTTNGAAYDEWNGVGACLTLWAVSNEDDVGWFEANVKSSWRTNRGC